MKKLLTLTALFGLFLGFSAQAQSEPIATLKDVQGEVFVQAAGSTPEQWTPVTSETPLNTGDSVKTGNGSSTLTYTDQATFSIGANTSLVVEQQADTEDIRLLLGSLKGNINKEKTVRPFQVVTPTAVGAVRGTMVDFDFNADGELTVDLHNGGPVQVYNDETGLDLNLDGKNKIKVIYNKETGEITIENDCDSDGVVKFTLLGQEYDVEKCESKTVGVGDTAAGGLNSPDTNVTTTGDENNPDENPDDDPPPTSSPTTESEEHEQPGDEV